MVSQLSDNIYDDAEASQFDKDDANSRNVSEVYQLIICGEHEKLERHLEENSERFNVTRIFNQSGFTPAHLAAYKGQNRMCEILINFVLNSDKYKGCPVSQDGNGP